MVQLMKISIYFVIISIAAVATQDIIPQFGTWEQTPKSSLLSLGKKIKPLLIGYYKQQKKNIQSISVPKFLYSFDTHGIDTINYVTLSVIKVDGVDYIYYITVNQIFPSRMSLGMVGQYPCVQPYRKTCCSCQNNGNQ